MNIFIILICIGSIIAFSYMSGNKQANDLMVKVGDHFDSIPKWEKHSIAIDWVSFVIAPTILSVFAFGWYGLFYSIIAFIISSKMSASFLKNQLEKRLASKDSTLSDCRNKWLSNKDSLPAKVAYEQRMHESNVLKWLISHPKSGQHMALSSDENINPKIKTAFEHQVAMLDSLSKKSVEEE